MDLAAPAEAPAAREMVSPSSDPVLDELFERANRNNTSTRSRRRALKQARAFVRTQADRRRK